VKHKVKAMGDAKHHKYVMNKTTVREFEEDLKIRTCVCVCVVVVVVVLFILFFFY
jgi:hypothetical protein